VRSHCSRVTACAHVFAHVCVFLPVFVPILLKNGTNAGKIGLGNRDYLVVYLFTK